jgi:hypothetical protein
MQGHAGFPVAQLPGDSEDHEYINLPAGVRALGAEASPKAAFGEECAKYDMINVLRKAGRDETLPAGGAYFWFVRRLVVECGRHSGGAAARTPERCHGFDAGD